MYNWVFHSRVVITECLVQQLGELLLGWMLEKSCSRSMESLGLSTGSVICVCSGLRSVFYSIGSCRVWIQDFWSQAFDVLVTLSTVKVLVCPSSGQSWDVYYWGLLHLVSLDFLLHVSLFVVYMQMWDTCIKPCVDCFYLCKTEINPGLSQTTFRESWPPEIPPWGREEDPTQSFIISPTCSSPG